MSELRKLTDLNPGHSAVVKKLTASGSMRRRLQDMGFIEKSCVECLQKSPLGDPIAYLIKGTVIALRTEDSSNIIIHNPEN